MYVRIRDMLVKEKNLDFCEGMEIKVRNAGQPTVTYFQRE
jgi:hypothetical protein